MTKTAFVVLFLGTFCFPVKILAKKVMLLEFTPFLFDYLIEYGR
tara:strand:+ start:6147 stop:6278 length:132 start_codon:yes stop_codon:yes gene_type:complete